MKIVIAGATGFIGSSLRDALRARGHRLLLASRREPEELGIDETWTALDFSKPTDLGSLTSTLIGADVVVNAVGIVRETPGQSFATLHDAGPRALFAASGAAGVLRVVQISALGADEAATTRFHLSKRRADDFLLSLPLSGAVAQPSLVFGPGGSSTRLFTALATWPVLPLPSGGAQRLQPIHVDDLIDALVALVERLDPVGRVPLVGPLPLTLRQYLQALRQSLGRAPAKTLSVPTSLVDLAASLGDRSASLPLDHERWSMLQRGNVARVEPTASLLGRLPRPPTDFVARQTARATYASALLTWLLPLLRVSVALVWIVTGIVSLGIFPVDDSLKLLSRVGIPAPAQPYALYGAAVLDIILGMLSLMRRRPRWLWPAQIVLVLGYTAIISVRLPEFWLHPYGPILKNLPLLGVLLLLAMLDPQQEKRRDVL